MLFLKVFLAIGVDQDSQFAVGFESVDNQDQCDGLSLLQVKHKLKSDTHTLVHLPPMGMVKTHKTGSSTMLKILQNLASARHMAIMYPADDHHLGWPFAFPGKDNLALYGGPSNQYELIANHAVFNSEMWRSYLKPNPFFVVTLREPVSQAISAKNFYDGYNNSWDHYLDRSETYRKATTFLPMNYSLPLFAISGNSQAYDLGWYEHVGMTTAYDNNQTVIRKWLDSLDSDFASSGSIILTEHFDEGLVLLKERLGVEPTELAYRKENRNQFHTKPSQEQVDRLRKLYSVDIALYDHFYKRFWEHWQQTDPSAREEQLVEIKKANDVLNATCNAGACPPVWTTNEEQWTNHLDKMDQ